MRAADRSFSGLERRQQAEQLAAALPALLVAAERVATTVMQGVHGRRRVGIGETFWQFRHAQPGDPAQLVDWRQSAKGQHLYVREHEWEAAQTVWLWCDRSASMDYASSRGLDSKRERAELLLLALATLLSPLAELEGRLRSFAAQGVRGHLVQVLDPAEEELPFQGRTEFSGPENEGRHLIGRVESLRPAYRRRMAARREALSLLARRLGWGVTLHRTDRPPQTALLALYGALSHAGPPSHVAAR